MKKLKLMPSLKEKKRYVLLEIKAKNKQDVQKKVEKALLDFLGVLGYGEAGPMIIKISEKNKAFRVILSINRKSMDKIKAACAYSKIKCLKVSGTLKKLKEFL